MEHSLHPFLTSLCTSREVINLTIVQICSKSRLFQLKLGCEINSQSFFKDFIPPYRRLCIFWETVIGNIGAKCFSLDRQGELTWCTCNALNLTNWTTNLQKFHSHQNKLLLLSVCNRYSNRLQNRPKQEFLSYNTENSKFAAWCFTTEHLVAGLARSSYRYYFLFLFA